MEYGFAMLLVKRTETFDCWLLALRDRRAAARIVSRIQRAEGGNLGDVRSVGEGVQEMRIDYGPGYRVSLVQRGGVAVLLLCGGEKGSQSRDISDTKRLAKEWKDWS